MAVALAKSPDAVFITDRMSRIVEWNQGAERLLGFSEAEALGESCAALLGGCDGWGNRYCTENCPVKEMAARSEPIRPFDLRFRTREPAATAHVDLTILHLTVAPPSHFFLVHILRSARAGVPAAPREEEAPKAGLTAARESADARARRLTQREVEILGLMAAGRMSGEIASLLNLSVLTVRNHSQNILTKLEVRSKAEAVAFAFQKHLV